VEIRLHQLLPFQEWTGHRVSVVLSRKDSILVQPWQAVPALGILLGQTCACRSGMHPGKCSCCAMYGT
jgi:hypothetical protein